MVSGFRVVAILAALGARPTTGSPGRAAPAPGWGQWLGDPRSAVLIVLIASLALGGGRKLLQWWRARAAVERLGQPDPSVEEVEAAALHGRAALMDLFRILSTAEPVPLRAAAGRALAALWAQDNLIAEEEKALVLRGFSAVWRARRRYPRTLRGPIPMAVSYGVPFLQHESEPGRTGVALENLEWSHRILGTLRADQEVFSPWKAGAGLAEFALFPSDYETDGPHRLILHTRVRTRGLTDAWEIDLPQTTFPIEFDTRLVPDALLTLPDDTRAGTLARAVRLELVAETDGQPATYLALNEAFAIRNAPALVIATPLPSDLAHVLMLEIEGIDGGASIGAGEVVVSGQGTAMEEPSGTKAFPLGPIATLPVDAIDRPGTRRIRGVLRADPERGWADPDVRSIWPGTIETDWVEVQIVRR